MRGAMARWVWLTAALFGALLAGAARAQVPIAAGSMRALQQSRWIRQGSSHPHHVIYVFMDANCPYCHTLWVELQPYYRAGLQVRNILIGVISASSPGKAAAIFNAPNPAQALRANELHWGGGPDRRGGIRPIAHPSAADLRTLEGNLELMRAFGINGTPGLVFADAQGKVYVIGGLPAQRDLARIISMASVPRVHSGSVSGAQGRRTPP